jgi:hypothetical protein
MKKYLLASAVFIAGSTGVSAMMMPGMMGMGGMGGMSGLMGAMPGFGMGMGSMMPGMGLGMSGMGMGMPGMMGMGMPGMMTNSTNAGKAEIEKIKNSDLYQLGSGLLAVGSAIYGKVAEVATYMLMETMANQYRQQMSAYQQQMPAQGTPGVQYVTQPVQQYAAQPVQQAQPTTFASVANSLMNVGRK